MNAKVLFISIYKSYGFQDISVQYLLVWRGISKAKTTGQTLLKGSKFHQQMCGPQFSERKKNAFVTT